MDSLNQAQKKAVEHDAGPLLMAAGAGSGKTKALTSRLKRLIEKGVLPERLVAITFTNKAADEMRERVFGKRGEKTKASLRLPEPGEPFIGTFHSFGLRILRQELKHTERSNGFSIFDDDDSLRLVKNILKEMDLPKDRFRAPAVRAQISKIKSRQVRAGVFFAENGDYGQKLEEIFLKYEFYLKQNNAFDFDDLLLEPVLLFEKNPQILKKYQDCFSHILVDEYQDINQVQYDLICLLAKEHKNVSVVGDDAQAIYSFRGSDFKNFLNFEKDWPGATIIKLEQNYRSTKNIIYAAGELIKNNKFQNPKDLWTENEDGEEVKIVCSQDEESEATWIAYEIMNIQEKDPSASIGVLYRINAQSRAAEQALLSENIPYKIFGGLKFYERKEVKDVMAGLRFVLNPADEMSAQRLEKSLGKRVSASLLKSLPIKAKSLSPAEVVNLFVQEANYKNFLEEKFQNPQERLENILELADFASQFDSLEHFLERISLLQSIDTASSSKIKIGSGLKPVNLMTIHISKGLEFDYVFILGANEGLLPHEKSVGRAEEVEEERRLMYVAMTRARKSLYVSFHSFPSRFLYEIPKEVCKFISPSGVLDELPSEEDFWVES